MVDRRPESGAEESTAAPGADPRAVSRRRLLLAGASGAAAAAVGVTVVARDRQRHAVVTVRADDRATAADEQASFVGAAMHPFYGAHQPGITTRQPANATFAAFDLRTGVDKDALARLMRILTDDIARIMSGQPALADTAPQLAGTPAGVTVTIGYGPALFDKIGVAGRRPGGFADLPAFGNIDALQPAYTGGDLLLQITADDAVTTSHTLRMLLKDTRAFATPRWVQRGFRRANGSGPAGSTPRNLMGQIDGTVNPGTPAEFDRLVWHPGPGWFAGGTMMVLRRIKMNLDLWDALAPAEMEEAVGRTLPTGAPLSGGTSEHDPVNFSVADATGLPAIAPFAHIRQARGAGTAPQILRRPFNFDDTPDTAGNSDVGLLFGAFQASIVGQYLPIQQRLAAGDLMNKWTTPVGSAVFAIPPGVDPGGWIGQGLLS